MKIVNPQVGKHNQTIKNVGFRNRRLSQTVPIKAVDLPYELGCGKDVNAWVDLYDLLDLFEKLRLSYSNKFIIQFIVETQDLRVFRSKAFKINPREWAAGYVELKRTYFVI